MRLERERLPSTNYDLQANRRLVEHFLEALSGRRNSAALIRRFASDAVLVRRVMAFEAAFPGYVLTSEAIVADRSVLQSLDAADRERLLQAVEEPIHLEGVSIRLGASVGAALHPLHAESFEALLGYADARMYEQKRNRH